MLLITYMRTVKINEDYHSVKSICLHLVLLSGKNAELRHYMTEQQHLAG